MRRYCDGNLELIYHKPNDWYIQNRRFNFKIPPNNKESYHRLVMVTALLKLGVV